MASSEVAGAAWFDFDVPTARLERQFNEDMGQFEHVIRGDVELLNL